MNPFSKEEPTQGLPSVLVADDDVTTCKMLETLLYRWGYKPIPVSNGSNALDVLCSENAPNLAILDWVMPGMDGIEVIRKVRCMPNRNYTYMLLLTGRQEAGALVEGLRSGADDFVFKPFDASELQSRLAIGARIVNLEKQLREYAHNMEELATERAAQLIHADRLSSLGTMAAGMAHEINNPATAISSNLQLLEKIWGHLNPGLEYLETHAGEAGVDASQTAFCRTEMPGLISSSLSSLKRISKIVQSLKLYARKRSPEFQRCDINACIREALDLCAGPYKHNIQIQTALGHDLAAFFGDPQGMEQVIVNLVINAADAMGEMGGGTLRIATLQINEHQIEARIEDDGPGFSPEMQARLFTPFFTSKPAGKGTGLGLPICQSIIESFGGTIYASNRPEGGACFTISLPVMPSDQITGKRKT
jgi:two-component system, NtrC family, sensor kinase